MRKCKVYFCCWIQEDKIDVEEGDEAESPEKIVQTGTMEKTAASEREDIPPRRSRRKILSTLEQTSSIMEDSFSGVTGTRKSSRRQSSKTSVHERVFRTEGKLVCDAETKFQRKKKKPSSCKQTTAPDAEEAAAEKGDCTTREASQRVDTKRKKCLTKSEPLSGGEKRLRRNVNNRSRERTQVDEFSLQSNEKLNEKVVYNTRRKSRFRAEVIEHKQPMKSQDLEETQDQPVEMQEVEDVDIVSPTRTNVANDDALIEPSPSPGPGKEDLSRMEKTWVQQIHYDSGRMTGIHQWLGKSISHTLSHEANSAKIRPSLQNAIEFADRNIQGTMTQGFNNSLLIIGAPGSGKSLAVSRICKKVSNLWNSGSEEPRIGIVRLSGWAHSDERVAFKEIARQLCGALKLDYFRTASYAENIQFLRAVLKGLSDADKAALFILEDFDMFARNQKQTFLYCLLDSLQKSDAKAIVIGTSSRYDCLDVLEKRVKSRFSHRTIVLCPATDGVSVNPNPDRQCSPDDKENEGAHSILQAMLTIPENAYPDTVMALEHNKNVKKVFADPRIVECVKRFSESSSSLHELANVARWTISICQAKQDQLSSGITVESILKAFVLLDKQSIGLESQISRLSILDLSVLIAAYRVHSKQPDEALNFEIIHHEFRSYASSGDHVDNYSRTAAAKAFEHLISLGLLQVCRERKGPLARRDKHFEKVSLQVSRFEILEGVQKHEYCPIRLRDWCMKDAGPRTTAYCSY